MVGQIKTCFLFKEYFMKTVLIELVLYIFKGCFDKITLSLLILFYSDLTKLCFTVHKAIFNGFGIVLSQKLASCGTMLS